VGELGIRPCAKCGEFPTNDGDDHCLGNLGVVMNACCGHGKNKGYIQFDSGIIIRGIFEIEKFEPYDMPYKVRARQDIFDEVDRLEQIDNRDGYEDTTLKTLKWVMRME